MRKWIIIGIILVVVVGLAVGARIMWQMRQQRLLKELTQLDKEMREEVYGDVGENIATVKKFYAEMAVMYKKIDSLGQYDLFKVDNGSVEFKKYLISESRNVPYNFRFFPYENVKWKVTTDWADSLTLTPTWPWSMCYDYQFSKFPVTDSTTIRDGYMSSFYEDLNYGAKGFREIDSLPYLLVLVNFEDKDLHLYDEEYLASSEFIQAEFDGALIVYDLKAQRMIKAYPLEFTGSENVSYTYTDDPHSSEANNAFREAYADDLHTHFIEAATQLINDSLGIPKTRIDINKY